MNWTLVESNWAQFQGTVRARWLKLDEEQLRAIAGKRPSLLRAIQDVYGIERNEAERKTRLISDQYTEALNNARTRENEIRLAADGARSELDRLRGLALLHRVERLDDGARRLVVDVHVLTGDADHGRREELLDVARVGELHFLRDALLTRRRKGR